MSEPETNNVVGINDKRVADLVDKHEVRIHDEDDATRTMHPLQILLYRDAKGEPEFLRGVLRMALYDSANPRPEPAGGVNLQATIPLANVDGDIALARLCVIESIRRQLARFCEPAQTVRCNVIDVVEEARKLEAAIRAGSPNAIAGAVSTALAGMGLQGKVEILQPDEKGGYTPVGEATINPGVEHDPSCPNHPANAAPQAE